MVNSQFKFSLCVGAAMVCIGGVIATSASVGVPLAILGGVIVGIALFHQRQVLLPVTVNEKQNNR